MKTRLLLPNKYKTFGILLFTVSLILGILVRFRDFHFSFLTIDSINLTDEIALSGLILSLLFIAFAREKNEDEFINHTRLESWQWAVLINYILLLIATWAIHGFAYIDVMMYNMLTIPIIFISRFHYVLYKTKSITEN
jgi:hypothetical protein